MQPTSSKNAASRLRPAYVLCVQALALAIGCSDADRVPTPETAPTDLIADDARAHDFGLIIGGRGQRMRHRYRLTNTTRSAVRILNVVNRKPCCGEVTVSKKEIPPGAAVDVEVVIRVGQEFGGLVHEAEVLTDHPSAVPVVLRTTAHVVPPIRVEELSNSSDPIVAGTKGLRRAGFRVIASGTDADPPIDLDLLKPHSSVRVEWSGPTERGVSDDGLKEDRRNFVIVLDSEGSAGPRSATISLRLAGRDLYQHEVRWEVVAPITASPQVVVIKPPGQEARILLKSHDGRPFKVLRVECDVPAIEGRAARAAGAVSHVITVRQGPGSVKEKGRLTVLTDHPAQSRVELPLVVLN